MVSIDIEPRKPAIAAGSRMRASRSLATLKTRHEFRIGGRVLLDISRFQFAAGVAPKSECFGQDRSSSHPQKGGADGEKGLHGGWKGLTDKGGIQIQRMNEWETKRVKKELKVSSKDG